MSERLFNILIKLAVGLVVGYSMVIGGPSGCATSPDTMTAAYVSPMQ
jgi:hypothetical protein